MWKGWLCCHTVPPRKSGRPSKSPSPKSKPKEEHTTTVKVCEPVQNNHDSRNAAGNSAAIPNASTTRHDDLPPPVSTTNGISPVPDVGSTTAKHSRPEGPSVSFTTNVDFEQDTTSLEHTSPRLRSFTYRPAWTLQDVPGGDDSDVHISVTRFGDDKSSRQSTKTSQECVRTSCRSFTKILDEDVDALFTNSHRFSRPGSLFHPTFVLPRISTEPNASTMSESMDDMTGQPLKLFPVRRGSMIVRSGRTNVAGNATFTGTSPDQTVAMEGVIVTPFAQVLVSLQRIRHAFIRLTSAQSTHRFGVISSAVPEPTPSELLLPDSPEYKAVAMETLEELEWCLKQLENIQTKRPVSDMAFSKFKRLLNKELNSFGETDKSRHEISAYICGTFLEDEKDTEANQQIEQMLERRRSSGQSHGSSNTTEQPTAAAGSKSKPVGEKETSGLIPDGPTSELITRPPDSSVNTQVAPDEGIDDDVKDVSKVIQMPVNGIVTPNDIELDEVSASEPQSSSHPLEAVSNISVALCFGTSLDSFTSYRGFLTSSRNDRCFARHPRCQMRIESIRHIHMATAQHLPQIRQRILTSDWTPRSRLLRPLNTSGHLTRHHLGHLLFPLLRPFDPVTGKLLPVWKQTHTNRALPLTFEPELFSFSVVPINLKTEILRLVLKELCSAKTQKRYFEKIRDKRFTQTLDTWGADIFEIDRLSDGHALTTTAYRIFQ
ncbi:hypothetical protein X801_01941, partial [Opisthorchis viverrini]